MRVLVVGGTRFVGRGLVQRLVARGYEVTILNRGLQPDLFGERVERLIADRTTSQFGTILHGRSFNVAIDFAAYDGADARGAVEALRGQVGHYIAISSGQVYLVKHDQPMLAREIDYEGPLIEEPAEGRDRNNWLYGMGKREMEDVLAAAWEEERFPATRLRLPMVSGELDHAQRVQSYLHRILDGGPVIIPDGGHHPTRHVYSGSVINAIQGMLGREATFGEAYNLAQEETPTLAELVRLLCDQVGASPRIVDLAAVNLMTVGISPVDISPFSAKWMSFLDPSKAVVDLNFRHKPLDQYLGNITACFLAHTPPPPEDYVEYRAREIVLANGA